MESKSACPRCVKNGGDSSGDNLHNYGEGLGSYCWSCGFTILSDEKKAELGIGKFEWTEDLEEEVSTKQLLTKEEVEQIKGYTGTKGKGARNISDETYSAYGVRFKYDEQDGNVVETFYPYTQDFAAAGFKIRIMNPKDFRSIGKIGKDSDLFGQWKWKQGGGKYVLLTAGEADALAAFQMLETYRKGRSSDFEPIPVVSSGIGESGSYKQVQLHYEWLNSHERILVCYDQDDAGKKAVEKLMTVLPKGKTFIVNLPMKDVNAMLDAGKQKQFISCFYDAKPYSPDGIVGSGSAPERARLEAAIPKIPLPPFMKDAQKAMAGGIPLGRWLNLGGASGQGKSTISEECVYHWIFNSPHKLGIISLESDVGQYHLKLLSRHVGRKIDLIESDEEKLDYLETQFVKDAEQRLVYNEDGSHRYFILDERDGGIDSLKNLIEQLIIQCECKVILLDPLQDALDGMSNEEQAVFCRWVKGMMKSHNVTFIMINHTRKTSQGGKQGSQGADLSEEDCQGTSAIYKSAACNLMFSRNKEAEDLIERNTVYMKMTKCRWTGNTGTVGEYYYDNAVHTMYDKQEWMGNQHTTF